MSGHRRPVASQGWDHHTEIVDEVWIERTPLTPATAARLAVEVALMPRLAPRLPLAVPVAELVAGDPPRGCHRLVPGIPVSTDLLNGENGAVVGHFLRALHDSPPSVWDGTGIVNDQDQLRAVDEMEQDVLPLLPPDLREGARALLSRCRLAMGRTVLRHGDLGPDHLLTTDGRVTGVIDWTDVALGDPALDLAWLLHGTSSAFTEALVAAYRPTPEELARGRDWHLLGPWWEVRHGLETGTDEYVASGLAGVVGRLRTTP